MPLNDRRRQKKLERKKAKRKAVAKAISRNKQGGAVAEMQRVNKAPVLHSLVGQSIWETGMGPVLLSRQINSGWVAFAHFLLDVHCLGVKDAFGTVLPASEYHQKILLPLTDRMEAQPVSPAYVRKLVEGAVAFAASVGLGPHPDYRITRQIFGTIDPGECTEEFEFGVDGQPCYVSGPFDTPERVREILSILTHTRGAGNFQFTSVVDEIDVGDMDLDSEGIVHLTGKVPQDGLLEDEEFDDDIVDEDDFDEDDEVV